MRELVAIRATRTHVELPAPLRFGGLEVTRRSYLQVEAALDDGTIGRSRAIDRGIDAAAIVRDIVAPAYMREPSAAPEELWDSTLLSASPSLSAGAGLRALSLVDIAVHNAHGTLAAPAGDTPPVWVIVGYPPDASADVVAQEVRAAAEAGAAGVKVPFGADHDESRRRIAAAIDAIGPGRVAVDLALSARTPEIAARSVEGFDLAWVEDPFVPGSIRDLARLRSLLDVPLAAGDEDSHLGHPFACLDAEAVDIVRLDAVAQGGATRMIRVAQQLDKLATGVSWHMNADLHSAVAAKAGIEGLSVEVSGPGTGADPLDEVISIGERIAALR